MGHSLSRVTWTFQGCDICVVHVQRSFDKNVSLLFFSLKRPPGKDECARKKKANIQDCADPAGVGRD